MLDVCMKEKNSIQHIISCSTFQTNKHMKHQQRHQLCSLPPPPPPTPTYSSRWLGRAYVPRVGSSGHVDAMDTHLVGDILQGLDALGIRLLVAHLQALREGEVNQKRLQALAS